MVTSFSGGGSRSTRREPSTMSKQLVNFYHLQLRVECTLFCNLQSRARIGDRLVWIVISNDLTHWATQTPAVMYNTSPFQYTTLFYLDRCSQLLLLFFSSFLLLFGSSVFLPLSLDHIYYFNFPMFKISTCIYFMKTKIYEVT